jgi:hypothetical protein
MLYDCPSGATIATAPRTAPVSAFVDCALTTLLNATIMKSDSSNDVNVFRLGGRVITMAMPRHCHVQWAFQRKESKFRENTQDFMRLVADLRYLELENALRSNEWS